jgi:hypothetical protein
LKSNEDLLLQKGTPHLPGYSRRSPYLVALVKGIFAKKEFLGMVRVVDREMNNKTR